MDRRVLRRCLAGLARSALRARAVARGARALRGGQLARDALAWIGWNPFPGIPNLLTLLLGPLFMYAFAGMVGDQLPPAQWRSVLLDVGGFALAVLAFTLALYLPHAQNTSALSFAVATAYPVMLFAAAAAGVVVQLHLRQRLTPASLALVGGLGGYGAVWMAWNIEFLQGNLHPGDSTGLLFSVFALLLGWGASRCCGCSLGGGGGGGRGGPPPAPRRRPTTGCARHCCGRSRWRWWR